MRAATLIVGVTIGLVGPAWAQSTPPAAPAAAPQTPPPAPPRPAGFNFGPYPPGWQIDFGPGMLAVPQFPGSNSLRVLPIPALDIRYKNKFFASVQQGIGYNLVNERRWRAGPIIRPEFGRTSRDIARFPGLQRIAFAPELGGFVAWQPNLFTTVQFELRQAAGGHEGLVGDLSLRRIKLKGRWIFGYGARLRFANERYNRRYFGVTTAQAATSGLAPFAPGGNLNDIGVSAFASRRLSDKWYANAFVGYSRLVLDAADSPITRSRFGSPNQVTLGATLSYRFRFK